MENRDELLHNRIGRLAPGFERIPANDRIGRLQQDESLLRLAELRNQRQELVRGRTVKIDKEKRHPGAKVFTHQPQQERGFAAAGAARDEGVLWRPSGQAQGSLTTADERLACAEV